jgi:quercetin dioxygenase-like cupin family protein
LNSGVNLSQIEDIKYGHISDFKSGWILGNFRPSIIKTEDVEVGIHHMPKGYIGDKHYHEHASEWNFIISGKVVLRLKYGSIEFRAGQYWLYEPGQKSNLEFLEDTVLVVVKSPSMAVNDKFY